MQLSPSRKPGTAEPATSASQQTTVFVPTLLSREGQHFEITVHLAYRARIQSLSLSVTET